MKRILWGLLLLVSLVVVGCGAGGTVNDPSTETDSTNTDSTNTTVPVTISQSGVGTSVAADFTVLAQGNVVFTATHDGSSNIIAEVKDSAGQVVGLAVNEIGTISDISRDVALSPGDYHLSVIADGNWTIKINGFVAGGTGTGGVVPVGTGNATLGASLGALTDIGDSVFNNTATGFEYYYTAVVGINAANEIIGYTSTGPMPFVQNPTTKVMQTVSAHGGFSYDDFYNLKATPSENRFEATKMVEINDNSQIIGNSYAHAAKDNTRGYIFKYDFSENTSTFVDLPPINYLDTAGKRKFKEYSNVVDINAAGWVFLTADDKEGVKKAHLWDGVTMQTVIDLLRDDETSVPSFNVPQYIDANSIENQPTFAVAINDNKTPDNRYQYVCNSGDSAFVYDGFVYTTLNQFNGSPLVAVDMNNKLPVGHVVGNAGNDGFFWAGGVIYPIKNLNGAPVTVVDINNNDIVVGNSGGQAFVWHLDPVTKTGVFEAIGSLGGGTSTAVAINDNGVVIGKSTTGASVTAGGINYAVEHGFAWRNKVIYDLGTHVPTYLYPLIPDYPFSEAVAITETNTIVGNSYSINAHKRGFIISPTIP